MYFRNGFRFVFLKIIFYLSKILCIFISLTKCPLSKRLKCTIALLELIEEITTSFDNKKATVGIIHDLKKAFDTTDHNLLLQKLEHYGIRGITHDWIKSYLYN